jgi:hypothetical protein
LSVGHQNDATGSDDFWGKPGDEQDDECRALKVLSINVTALTKRRLLDVLAEAEAEDVSVIALQETRHPQEGFPFVGPLLAKHHCRWRVQWSEGTPADEHGRRGCGGTALLWRDEMGRGRPLDTKSHRTCIRSWNAVNIASAYGDVQRADVDWFTNLLGTMEGLRPQQRIAVGDFNWKRCYGDLLGNDWVQAEVVVTHKAGRTSPTRCVVQGEGEVAFCKTINVPGVPTHLAVVYSVGVKRPSRPKLTRVKRASNFVWSATPNEEEQAALRNAADAAGSAPCLADGLEQAWNGWFRRFEAVLKCAEEHDLAVNVGGNERAKGSEPESRRAADADPCRAGESIKLRRLKRLGRAVNHQRRWSEGAAAAPLTPEQQKHWSSACSDGLVPVVPKTQFQAAGLVDVAIADEARRCCSQNNAQWKRKFAGWTMELLSAAKEALKPMQPAFAFTAEDMREDWLPFWAPNDAEGRGRGQAWRQLAMEAGIAAVEQREWEPPSFQAFCTHVAGSEGSPGFDAVMAEELRSMLRHADWIIVELWQLWVLTSREAAAKRVPRAVVMLLYKWRVVGIPKRNSEDARPIAIASCIVRCWHSALNQQLPEPPNEQWCGKKASGVVEACADWMRLPSDAGSEQDLAKAFDLVEPEVAETSLRWHGAAEEVVATLALGWSGERYCHVGGEIARPISPTRGLPPGDPPSPKVLAFVIAPWHGLVERQTECKTWAYCDDRSLKARRRGPGPSTGEEREPESEVSEAEVERQQQQVSAAIEITLRFDEAIGLKENVKKRQLWTRDQTVEHLGLRCQGGAEGNSVGITAPKPRDGWDPVRDIIKKLARLPGSMATRARIATIFVCPKYRWSAPLIEVPPADLVGLTFRALKRTATNWWCAGRFFADNVRVHPVLGTAVVVLKAVNRVRDMEGRVLRHAVEQHAAVLGFKIHSWTRETGVLLRSAGRGEQDPRTDCAMQAGNEELCKSGLFFGHRDGRVISTALPAGQHAIRIAARVAALRSVRMTRHDAEGIENVDMEAQSHPVWKKYLKESNADPQRAMLLSVWRHGAIHTATRRWYRTDQCNAHLTVCRLCGADLDSARHRWAECPGYADVRVQLSVAYGIGEGWWLAQPRCTAKSGWITLAAAITVEERACLQVAACKMGMAIMARSGCG